MGYEIDSIKRDISSLKYELSRKVDDENFRNKIHQLDRKIEGLESTIRNEVYNLNEKIDRLIETIESKNV